MKAPDTPSYFCPQRATKSPPETELQERRESKRRLLGVSSETWLCLQTSGCHLSVLCNHCKACQKMIAGYTSRIPKSVILVGGRSRMCALNKFPCNVRTTFVGTLSFPHYAVRWRSTRMFSVDFLEPLPLIRLIRSEGLHSSAVENPFFPLHGQMCSESSFTWRGLSLLV